MPNRGTSRRAGRLALPLAALALLGSASGAQAATTTAPVTPAATAGGAVAPGTTVGATRTTVGPGGVTSSSTVTAAVPRPTVTSPATTPAPAAQGTGIGRASTAPTAAKSSGRISDGALLAAIVAGLIALACLIWAIFRFGAFEPHWLLSLRHSLAEGSFRASATWAEFTDWIRLGR
jgi:hypothetical protein